VNPQWHDEFVALCALFPSGELTDEEWALLQVHLAYCDSCRRIFDQFQQTTSDAIPVIAAAAAQELSAREKEPSFSLSRAEERLMRRLDQAPAAQTSNRAKNRWKASTTALAACIAFVTGITGLYLYHTKARPSPVTIANANVEAPQITVPVPSVSDELRSKLDEAEQKNAELQRQIDTKEDRYRQVNLTATSAEEQLEAEKAESKKITEERDALTLQLAAARIEAQSLRDRSATMNIADSQQTAHTAALEAKLRDVSATLEEKDKMLALDKELLAHDRDIRDLIGARDLYIADIFDVAKDGKTNKPFGRVFYTKDKSLVFYGYDLDKQAGLKQAVAFQAWGGSDDKPDVSLGLFYQDDTHKRWVLRFNDTKTLAHLNKVFVTAEPQGGSTKPTGKPLLLAYLQIQPNHP
jgi:hypothetical protein